jgi:hypothetical protein
MQCLTTKLPTLTLSTPADVAAIVDMEAHHSKSAIDSAQWRRKINTYSNTKAKMQKKFAAPSVEL